MEARDQRLAAREPREVARPAPLVAPSWPLAQVLALQRSAGNQAVSRALSAPQTPAVLARTVSDAEYATLSVGERRSLEGPVTQHLVQLVIGSRDPAMTQLATTLFGARILGLIRTRLNSAEQLRQVIRHFERARIAEAESVDPAAQAREVQLEVVRVLKNAGTVPASVKARLGNVAGKGGALENTVSIHGMFDFAMAGAAFAKRTRPADLKDLPAELVAVAVEISNLVEGTEAFAEGGSPAHLHLRAGRADIHVVVHESLHALASPTWDAASWPVQVEAHRFLLEGTTELLTMQVLDETGRPRTVKAYDGEKVRVEQLCGANGVSMAALADLYFNGSPVTLAERLGLLPAAAAPAPVPA